MSRKNQTDCRQRLASAIEDSYPRELSAFIDYIAHGYPLSNKYALQRKALEFARLNYDAAKEATP